MDDGWMHGWMELPFSSFLLHQDGDDGDAVLTILASSAPSPVPEIPNCSVSLRRKDARGGAGWQHGPCGYLSPGKFRDLET